jgi:hypothetical protein
MKERLDTKWCATQIHMNHRPNHKEQGSRPQHHVHKQEIGFDKEHQCSSMTTTLRKSEERLRHQWCATQFGFNHRPNPKAQLTNGFIPTEGSRWRTRGGVNSPFENLNTLANQNKCEIKLIGLAKTTPL